MKRNLVHMEV